MAFVQTTKINDGAQDKAGFCLRFAQKVFNTKPYGYVSAWIAWEKTMKKHHDRNFPTDVVSPVWFSHMGNYDGGGLRNWGHVAAYFPGRGFLSSPGSGTGQQWFGSIQEIERYFRCTFVGWSEDINDLVVMTGVPDPAPEVLPAPAGRTERVIVPGDTLWQIATEELGDGARYMEIFNASAFRSGDPNLIFPGEVAVIVK
jgi:hypothetical protein